MRSDPRILPELLVALDSILPSDGSIVGCLPSRQHASNSSSSGSGSSGNSVLSALSVFSSVGGGGGGGSGGRLGTMGMALDATTDFLFGLVARHTTTTTTSTITNNNANYEKGDDGKSGDNALPSSSLVSPSELAASAVNAALGLSLARASLTEVLCLIRLLSLHDTRVERSTDKKKKKQQQEKHAPKGGSDVDDMDATDAMDEGGGSCDGESGEWDLSVCRRRLALLDAVELSGDLNLMLGKPGVSRKGAPLLVDTAKVSPSPKIAKMLLRAQQHRATVNGSSISISICC
jgi:hypothetical protein